MLLFSQGCRIFQNLQNGKSLIMTSSSVTSCKKAISVVKEDSVQIPCFCPDNPVKHPNPHQSATSVWKMWQYPLDPHQCLKASNYSRLHLSGRNGKSSSRSSEFQKNPAFKCICPDDVGILSGHLSVFHK
jgi:hypothetical protein